jgi:hypothetical protein
MLQISKCTSCNTVTTFEPVKVSKFIFKACHERLSISRQLKYLANFILLEGLLPKTFEAFQCNVCGEVYHEVPETGKSLFYVNFDALSIEACKVLSEYDNGQCIVQFGKCKYGVNASKDINWFTERQIALSALVDFLLLKGEPLAKLRGIA